MGISRKIAALFAVACLSVVCLGLAACGGSSSSSAASASGSASASSASASASAASESASASASSASASASSSAASANSFVGTWTMAAAESQGVTMAGNFAAMYDMTEVGTITLNEDGTGQMNLGGDSVALKWAETGADAITLTAEATTDYTGESIPVTYKDGALFMSFEQDGQSATAIFTQDGTYDGAKVIDLASAKPITAEADLLGSWKLVGMQMMGITVYGSADALASMSGGTDPTITFEQGGVFKTGETEGTWAVDANGATVTTDDITGTNTYPVLMLEDGGIVFDMTELMQGQEFAMLYEK